VPEGFVEIERYWIEEPYSMVQILLNERTKVKKYCLVEPPMSPFEYRLLERLFNDLQELVGKEEVGESIEEREEFLERKVRDLLRWYGLDVDEGGMLKLLYYLKRNFLRYGKITALLKDDYIEDISCTAPNSPIFLYHRVHHSIETNISFEEGELDAFVMRLCQRSGKHISYAKPLVDATMPDGSRLQATLGRVVTSRGSSFTIRRFREEPITPVHLMKYGTVSADVLVYLWLAIENKKSLIFLGGTATGKTSILNAVSLFIPPTAKIVSIEDTREVRLHHPNWIASVTKEGIRGEGTVTMFDLLKAALRQRPEYILVGEVRGVEAITLFQAMSTGHATYSTMHADSVQSAINRLESDPINLPHIMLNALHGFCIQQIVYKGEERLRRTKVLVELTGIDPHTGRIRINEVFRWNPYDDSFEMSSPEMYRIIMRERGWSEGELKRELSDRKALLTALLERDVRDYRVLSEVFHRYYLDKEGVMSTYVEHVEHVEHEV